MIGETIRKIPASARQWTCLSLLVVGMSVAQVPSVDLKGEYLATLKELTGALMDRQIIAPGTGGHGAIRCSHCSVLHTRAAETVFPFSMMFSITHEDRYRDRAILLARWLMKQQEKDGSWKETPEEWTGTTTDQLLMLLLSFDLLSPSLSPKEREEWSASMQHAAEYLAGVMSPEFASINYVATTTATLAAASQRFHRKDFAEKARSLAWRTIAKMDEEGFINGEGGRSYQNKSGVDLGYDLEMSLWGLGYYARILHDTAAKRIVLDAARQHLYFIYPDGSMDGSWGIRSNKWTAYGGATSDGCQILFTLFADDDPRFAAAAFRNLQFLRTNMRGGIIGFGPQHWEIFSGDPCIYPTFAKAKNLAVAYMLETAPHRPLVPIPSEQTGWMRLFPTLDLALLRSQGMMATVTAYRYKDPAGAKSKYMHRPSGGALSHLWVNGIGFLQASSVTAYSRPEPMHFPEAPGIRSLTPRIEFRDSSAYFTDLYEFDAALTVDPPEKGEYRVWVTGEMKDARGLMGGVRYRRSVTMSDSSLTKTLTLRYHDAAPEVTVVEPIIDRAGTTIKTIDARNVEITVNGRTVRFTVVQGDVRLIVGREREHFWAPYPAFRACPIELIIPPPASGFTATISYRLTMIDPVR